MLKRIGFIKLIKCCWIILFLPYTASAFHWTTSASSGYLNSSSVPTSLGNITSGASSSASITAYGWPDSVSQDRVRITSVAVGSGMTQRGFSVQVRVGSGSWMGSTWAGGSCVWLDSSCSLPGGNRTSSIQPISVRLVRNSTAAYDPIPPYTLIAIVYIAQSSVSGGGAGANLYFYTSGGTITPVNPTCNVKDFDKTLMLPPVNRDDISSHGVGRYSGATKEFDITLECSDKPKISVKFDGDKMTGIASDEVLANKATGNDNVGIQILHKDNPIKFGTAFEILTSTQKNESLKFNAYYYYKGGTVSPGPVKAQAEFLFTYK